MLAGYRSEKKEREIKDHRKIYEQRATMSQFIIFFNGFWLTVTMQHVGFSGI